MLSFGKNKISTLKDIEHIFKFGQDRFASSPEDICFYTGFRKTTYVHHFGSRLTPTQPTRITTGISRNCSDIVPNAPFQYFNAAGK